MRKIENKFKITVVIICFFAIILCTVCYFGGSVLKKAKARRVSDTTTWKYAKYIQSDIPYHVVKVIDGDTMIMNVSGHDTTVRLIGIDTPETVDPRKPVGCFGHEASDKGKSMLVGQDVYLEKDPLKGDYDKYGRALVYVRLPPPQASSTSSPVGNILYNQLMLEGGFAREYTFSAEPYKYQNEFKTAQDYARQAGLGLWASSTCNGK